MELINLLIKPKQEFCLLCIKESDETLSCYIDLKIEGNFFNATLNISDMIKYLFPTFELISPQVCTKCMDLIIEMYINIRRNECIKVIISTIIDVINHNLNNNVNSNGAKKININFNKILKNSNDSNFILNEILTDTEKEANVEHILKQCPNCFKTFDNNKSYKTHIRNHRQKRKQKYYFCNNCNYKSLCKTSVEGHMNKKHLNTRPYICETCYKSYYHKKNLIAHIESHRQSHNNICHVCGEQFLHKKNLTEHLKLHSGDRAFECELCSKKFVTSGRRLEHIKRIHMEKSENCLLCEKRFSLKKELTRHMKTVHSSL